MACKLTNNAPENTGYIYLAGRVYIWLNGPRVGIGLRLEMSRARLPAVPVPGTDCGKVVHTHVCFCHQAEIPVTAQRCPRLGR